MAPSSLCYPNEVSCAHSAGFPARETYFHHRCVTSPLFSESHHPLWPLFRKVFPHRGQDDRGVLETVRHGPALRQRHPSALPERKDGQSSRRAAYTTASPRTLKRRGNERRGPNPHESIYVQRRNQK